MSGNHTPFEGGGDMGAQVRAHEWSRTSLGTPDTWPVCLRIMLSNLLSAYWVNSKHPSTSYSDAAVKK